MKQMKGEGLMKEKMGPNLVVKYGIATFYIQSSCEEWHQVHFTVIILQGKGKKFEGKRVEICSQGGCMVYCGVHGGGTEVVKRGKD